MTLSALHRAAFAALALSGLAGCDTLDKDPLPNVSPETFFRNAEDAESALVAVYDALQGEGLYGLDLNVVGEMPSDNATSVNGDVTTLDAIAWTPTTKQVNTVWNQSYVAIARANAVIQNVPGVEMNVARRAQIVGEAHWVRALAYFHLARLYGGVPLRTEVITSGSPEVTAIPRASLDETYARVLADLDAADGAVAAQFGSPALDRGRATQGAVDALRAQVLLTRGDWAAAAAAAERVLANPLYQLAPSFDDLWPPGNYPEAIFEAQFAGSPDAGFVLPDVVLPSPPASYSFPKFNIPTAELLAFTDAEPDARWDFDGESNVSFIQRPGSGNDGGPFVYKWRSNPSFFNSPDNYTVMRLGGLKLVFAEASNEAQGPNAAALRQLNDVRQRAGLPALTLAGVPTREAFRAEVDRQRRLELAFEGERWFDLLRYERHEQAGGSHAVTALDLVEQQRGARDATYLLFPIPQNELNNNPAIVQNPGF